MGPNEAIKNYIEMYESLFNAMDKAGGAPLNILVLKDITAQDLLSRLCTNGIRFCYTEKVEKVEKKKR